MKLVMLDGLCGGQVFINKYAPPEWTIIKPFNTNYSQWEVDEYPELTEPERLVYKRTFLSLDGKLALYTLDGDSESIFDTRDWVTHKKYPFRRKDAIHFINTR